MGFKPLVLDLPTSYGNVAVTATLYQRIKAGGFKVHLLLNFPDNNQGVATKKLLDTSPTSIKKIVREMIITWEFKQYKKWKKILADGAICNVRVLANSPINEDASYEWVYDCKLKDIPSNTQTMFLFEAPQGEIIRVASTDDFEKVVPQ